MASSSAWARRSSDLTLPGLKLLLPGAGLVLCLSSLVLLPGCRRGPAARPGEPRVALVMKTPNNPFFVDMQRGAEAAARRLGVELVVQSPEREIDVEKQMQIVENLI